MTLECDVPDGFRYDDKQKTTLELLVNEANHRKSGS